MPVSILFRHCRVLLASLLIAAAAGGKPAFAAEVLELRLDDLRIPINLVQLERWSQGGTTAAGRGGDLAVWLNLLDPDSRNDLRKLLQAPVLRDTSFGRQLLDTWAGGKLLAQLGDLLTTAEGTSTTAALQSTLRQLLERGTEVTTIELLRAIPLKSLSLQVNGLYALADQWRQQLSEQGNALRGLEALGLPEHPPLPMQRDGRTAHPQRLALAVPHRGEALPLEIWKASPANDPVVAASGRPWILIMPGLGGNADQLGWWAADLAELGWPVVVLQHPGSDGPALKAALEGQRPPPGAETLADRLEDARAVLAAQRRGELPVAGDGVVLAGHSMGGLAALFSAGLDPEPGLAARCRRAVRRLPITNPSLLLQCQLASTGVPPTGTTFPDLRGLVLFNGFGGQLWPRRGLGPLPVPVLMVGGSLDLVTPPVDEQLQLFLPRGNDRSRLVIVDGGSHFSPVRMTGREEVLFRLGDDLVGVEPVKVQKVLLRLTVGFLQSLQSPRTLPPQRMRQEDVTAYVLDHSTARRWRRRLRP